MLYVGDNNSIWCYTLWNGAWVNQDLNNGSFLNNASGAVISYDEINRRVYYSSGTNLHYYEYSTATTPNWIQHQTSVNNVNEFTSMAVRDGFVYYKDINNDLWVYFDSGNGWIFHTLNWNGGTDNIYSSITLDKQSSRAYYVTWDWTLGYYEWIANPAPGKPHWQRFEDTRIIDTRFVAKMLANGQLLRVTTNSTINSYDQLNNPSNPISAVAERDAAHLIEEEGDKIYYFTNNSELHMLQWGDCEILNPPVNQAGAPPTAIGLRIASATKASTGKNTEVLLYPNPSEGQLTIEIKQPGTRIQKVLLVDVLGKVCLEQEAQSHIVVIDGAELKPGLYYCHLRLDNGKTISRSVVIQR